MGTSGVCGELKVPEVQDFDLSGGSLPGTGAGDHEAKSAGT